MPECQPFKLPTLHAVPTTTLPQYLAGVESTHMPSNMQMIKCPQAPLLPRAQGFPTGQASTSSQKRKRGPTRKRPGDPPPRARSRFTPAETPSLPISAGYLRLSKREKRKKKKKKIILSLFSRQTTPADRTILITQITTIFTSQKGDETDGQRGSCDARHVGGKSSSRCGLAPTVPPLHKSQALGPGYRSRPASKTRILTNKALLGRTSSPSALRSHSLALTLTRAR